MYENVIVVTRRTRLQELISRFNTRAQAKFYIEHSGGDFSEYDQESETYKRAQDQLHKLLPSNLKVQFIEREFVSNFVFTQSDIIVVLGQDGLVANTAKYVGNQPIIGINPDPSRYDGILVPNTLTGLRPALESVLEDRANTKNVTLALAQLSDGQKLLAFNDLFIGARSHISARYRIQLEKQSEQQSSSGVLISTGAGSTGWLSSVFNMVASVNQFLGKGRTKSLKLSWDDPALLYVVREPFISKHSTAEMVAGILNSGTKMIIESRMATEGTIFSDGVESDFMPFNAGSVATISAAPNKARLVMAPHARTAGQTSHDELKRSPVRA